MSSISELVTYIEKKRPGFEKEILGADPDELAEIEKFSRRPLPPTYREYLTKMGAFSAGFEPRHYSLDMFDVATSLATDVRDYPARYVKIGFDCSGREIPADLFFDYGLSLARDEPIVVVFNDGGIFTPAGVLPLYWTLLDFLLAGAFAQYGMRRLANSKIRTFFEEYGSGVASHAFSRAREILIHLGFHKVFDTPHLYAGEQNEDTVLLMSRPIEKDVGLDISIAEERRFKHLDSIFDDLSQNTKAGR